MFQAIPARRTSREAVLKMTQLPGRRSLVAALIRSLAHELAVSEANDAQRVHHLTTLSGPESVAFRERMGAMSTNSRLLPMDVVRNMLDAVVGHLRSLNLLGSLTAERSVQFMDEILNILTTPDADQIRANQVANIVAQTMKVIEPAIGAREPIDQQDGVITDFHACIADLVGQVQQGTLAIDMAISRISAETTWLLAHLRVDKSVLEEIPTMDAEILALLESDE